MIHDCPNLKKIIFESKSLCLFGESCIHNCKNLSKIYWPAIMNFEQISIYNNCPLLGNIIVYHRLLTCQNDDEILFLDKELLRINNNAFMSCKNARIVVIPSTIEQIEDHAFDHSLIQVIIFEGQYTMWKAMTHDNQDLYVYCSKDSNVVRSISPFEQNSFLHIKKNETLKELLRTKDIDQIKNYCYANMDQRTDEAMISTPYNWDFFSR